LKKKTKPPNDDPKAATTLDTVLSPVVVSQNEKHTNPFKENLSQSEKVREEKMKKFSEEVVILQNSDPKIPTITPIQELKESFIEEDISQDSIGWNGEMGYSNDNVQTIVSDDSAETMVNQNDEKNVVYKKIAASHFKKLNDAETHPNDGEWHDEKVQISTSPAEFIQTKFGVIYNFFSSFSDGNNVDDDGKKSDGEDKKSGDSGREGEENDGEWTDKD